MLLVLRSSSWAVPRAEQRTLIVELGLFLKFSSTIVLRKVISYFSGISSWLRS